MINSAYVCFGESPNSNLIQTQVNDLLINLRKMLCIKTYYLVMFVPWVYFIRQNNRSSSNFIEQLRENNICCKLFPLPIPFPYYSFRKGWKLEGSNSFFTIVVLIAYALPVLLYFIVVKRVTLFHCRSYPISFVVLILKSIFTKIKFIFDPRSDFPEENAIRKRWGRSNYNYIMWKYIELQCCKFSDLTIGIGEIFYKHINEVYSKTNSIIVYNNVDIYRFSYNEDFRKNYRKEKNIADSIVFCYSGSLYQNHWNDPILYAKFIDYYLKFISRKIIYLFLIPTHCKNDLIFALKKYRIKSSQYIIESPKFNDVPKFLSVGDVATYFLSYASPRVGTKFVEYCSMGLPTIVNSNACGASQLIEKHNLGLSFDYKLIDKKDKGFAGRSFSKSIIDLTENHQIYYNICRCFAEKFASNQSVAVRYADAYYRLLKPSCQS